MSTSPSFGKGRLRPLPATRSVSTDPGERGAPSDRRWSLRKSSRMPGVILPGGMSPPIGCTIADMSGTGARLLMAKGWLNPFRRNVTPREQFTLFMRMDRMEVECEIMRLEDNEIGVRFVSPPRPSTRRN